MNTTVVDIEDDIDRLQAEKRLLEYRLRAQWTEGTLQPMTRVHVRLKEVVRELRAMGVVVPCGCGNCSVRSNQ